MATEDKVLKLVGEQVDEIVNIDKNLPYTNGKRKEQGKAYNRYRYNGIVFTVDSDNDFCAHFDNGTIDSVKLLTGTRTVKVNVVDAESGETTEEEKVVDTLQFDSFISFVRTENRLKHTVKMDMLRNIATSSKELDSETLTAIFNGSVASV